MTNATEDTRDINEQKIIDELKNVHAKVQEQDQEAIAQSLASYVQTCAGEGLSAEETVVVLKQNGIEGGEPLDQFVVQQHAMASGAM